MKQIKQDFSLKAWGPAPWVNLAGRADANIQLFLEYGHVAYQIKGNYPCSNMVANTLPYDHPPPDPGVKKSIQLF